MNDAQLRSGCFGHVEIVHSVTPIAAGVFAISDAATSERSKPTRPVN